MTGCLGDLSITICEEYMQYTNNNNISLPMAVWLVADDYDHETAKKYDKYISATGLLKSPRQFILSKRVMRENKGIVMDLNDLSAARLGQSTHTAIQEAWESEKLPDYLKLLGIPESVSRRIIVNPSPDQLKPDSIPVYFEQRAVKQINGWSVGGQFDAIFAGALTDYKTTSVYTMIKGRNDDKYTLQGSIYRWLNPLLITEDHINIQFVFKDWQRTRSLNTAGYPKAPIVEQRYPLNSVKETELFIKSKLRLIDMQMDLPEEELDLCTDDDLWRDPSEWKYYANKDKTARATKAGFETLEAAESYRLDNITKNPNSIVIEHRGKAKACKWCPAAEGCSQYKALRDADDIAD